MMYLKNLWHAALVSVFCSVSAFAADVGQVQLLIGQASVLRDGSEQPLQQGQMLQEGDEIHTADQSLLQIKTIDDAFLSLRANTQLHIECYQVQCMKLNLRQGEMRQITGKQGQAHKDKYRLNTPVAAIGVRGTDFITRSQANDTWVRVLEGAIVAAPFGDDCSRQALGVCASNKAALLGAQDPFVLHIQPNSAPVAIPGDAGLQAKLSGGSEAQTTHGASQRTASEDVFVILRDHPEVVQAYLALVQANGVHASTLPSYARGGLAFATWTGSNDGMAQSYAQASQGRDVTVGDNQYALWRETGRYLPPKGEVSYQLAQSQAQLTNTQGVVTPVGISGGQLSINFDSRQLSTQMLAQVPGGDSMSISANGRMSRDDGIFAMATQQGGRIAGAIGNDGRQVGYLLNQPMNTGDLKVLTNWQMR